jgi:hypothetical protein
VTGCFECGDERSGSGTTEIVQFQRITISVHYSFALTCYLLVYLTALFQLKTLHSVK